MRKPAESLASGKVALVPLEPATTSEVRLYLKRNAAHSQAVVSFIGFLPYRQLLQGDRASSAAARPS
jgi:hypothetical protein